MKFLLMNSNDKKKKLVLGLIRNCGLVLKNTHIYQFNGAT